jgi:hypothetical protein
VDAEGSECAPSDTNDTEQPKNRSADPITQW